MMGDQREDLVAEGVDVALRFGPLSDSTATVRRILAWPRVLAASRAYLDKAKAPLTPMDLAQHAIILGPASLSGHWSFRKDDTATSFQVEGKLMIRASLGAIAAAVEGLGIVMTPFGAYDDTNWADLAGVALLTDRVIRMVDENLNYWTPMMEITRGVNCCFAQPYGSAGRRCVCDRWTKWWTRSSAGVSGASS